MEQDEQAVYGFPAQVRVVQSANREDLIALAKTRANDPAVFDESDPFFWAALISNDRVDFYWTHMARSSLENYARGAAEGVSFQNSHRWNELPLGASLTGRVEELESGIVQVVADFYTMLGMQLNGLSTDDFARGVRSGVLKDVSIGWSGGRQICDICHGDYTRYDICSHWAGKMYEIEENGVARKVRATVTIEDAGLHEVSAVYDGATPGAVILKARAAAADGRLRAKEAESLERMYRVALPVTRQFEGVNVPEDALNEEGRSMDVVAILDKHKVGVGLEADARAKALDSRLADFAAIEGRLATTSGELEAAQARVKELEPAAADGNQYRADLTTEALAEGVRAKGDKFDQARYEAMLRAPGMSLDTIKLMRDDWRAEGDTRLGGGRRSVDPERKAEGAQTVSVVPDAAYRG